MSTLLIDLQEPFAPDAITWLPGQATKDGAKCMAMAYGDLRAYMKRLDEVCGMDWSCRYVAWGEDRIMCELTIAGVTRTSTGEMGAQDEKREIGGTVAEAQAFKRACAMFGLGRYLYELPSVWVAFDNAAKKISKEGQAELDRRYQDWYRKTMAERKKNVTRHVEPSTGEIVDSLPVATDEIFGPPTELDKHREQFHALGSALYGKQWPVICKRNVGRITGNATHDANALTVEQLQRLIAGMESVKANKHSESEAVAA
jgi:hypothetical protein